MWMCFKALYRPLVYFLIGAWHTQTKLHRSHVCNARNDQKWPWLCSHHPGQKTGLFPAPGHPECVFPIPLSLPLTGAADWLRPSCNSRCKRKHTACLPLQPRGARAPPILDLDGWAKAHRWTLQPSAEGKWGPSECGFVDSLTAEKDSPREEAQIRSHKCGWSGKVKVTEGEGLFSRANGQGTKGQGRWQVPGGGSQSPQPPTRQKESTPGDPQPGRLGPTPMPTRRAFSPEDANWARFLEGVGINKDYLACPDF